VLAVARLPLVVMDVQHSVWAARDHWQAAALSQHQHILLLSDRHRSNTPLRLHNFASIDHRNALCSMLCTGLLAGRAVGVVRHQGECGDRVLSWRVSRRGEEVVPQHAAVCVPSHDVCAVVPAAAHGACGHWSSAPGPRGSKIWCTRCDAPSLCSRALCDSLLASGQHHARVNHEHSRQLRRTSGVPPRSP
jgi:hypothetical protein